MLSPESAVDLAEVAIKGSESQRADALFRLIKGLAGPQPPPEAPMDQKQRYDAAYAVLHGIFPSTTACQDAFSVEVSSVVSISDLAA